MKKTLKEENPCWDGYEMVGMKMKDGKEVPNCVPKTESVDEAASFKITNTISKKEWAKTHKDYKTVIDGVPYVMKLTDKGTALVPVKIVESVNEINLKSVGVKEFLQQLTKNQSLIKKLGFKTMKDVLAYVQGGGLEDWYDLKDDGKKLGMAVASANEDHSSDPNDKYVVRPCKNLKEPWAVWEGEVRVKGFATKEEAQAYADAQNKEQGLTEGNAFTGALYQARKEGKIEFEFNGKTYPVQEAKDETLEEGIKMKKLHEGSFSEIDIMAREARNFNDFVKEFYKDYKDFPKDRETIKWLKSLYDGRSRDESVVNEAKGTILSNKILDFLESKKAISGTNAQKVHKELTKYIEKLFDKNTFHESVVVQKESLLKPLTNESVNEGITMKLKSLLNESFGFGDLPSSKLIKMKKSLKEIESEESVNEDVFAIVDKYRHMNQDYDQVYFKDNDLNKVKKHMKTMGSKYGKVNLIRVKTNGKMELVDESVNEGYSTEEKRIVLMAVKKIMKYMNVDLPTAMNYVLGAGKELERDIEKGKVK